MTQQHKHLDLDAAVNPRDIAMNGFAAPEDSFLGEANIPHLALLKQLSRVNHSTLVNGYWLPNNSSVTSHS
jgi:hypothetical protein